MQSRPRTVRERQTLRRPLPLIATLVLVLLQLQAAPLPVQSFLPLSVQMFSVHVAALLSVLAKHRSRQLCAHTLGIGHTTR